MSRHQHLDSDALSAVRRFVHAAVAGRDVPDAMAAMVSETSRVALTRLGAWERALRTELRVVREARSGARWLPWTWPTPFLPWLELCSDNGFRREKALRALSEGAPNGFFCSLAVRRLNDWVPQVRAAAREHVPIMARRSKPEHVVDALWTTLPHSVSWGRMGDADQQVLLDLLSLHSVPSVLKSRLVTSAAGPATAVLAQAGRTPVLDGWLGEIAENAIQPAVRAKAYRSQLEGRMVWLAGRRWERTALNLRRGRFEPVLGVRAVPAATPFLSVLGRAAADRSPIVRRVAGEMLIQRLEMVGDEAADLAERLAADPSPSVAERGRFAVERLRGRS